MIPMDICGWCPKPLSEAADDNCVNPEHWSTDNTLGLRPADCGCCYLVDSVALESLRSLLTTPGGVA